MKVPFIDLKSQYNQIKKKIHPVLESIFKKSNFILGREVKLFEEEFSQYCGVKFAVGVNSGTDALFLGLLSLGVGGGDEVIVPTFTFIATALAVTFTGAKPVFVDIDEKTYNINVNKIEKAITQKTKAILPVHLYGQTADMKPILDIAKRYNLKVVEDAAQAHGAIYKNHKSQIPNPKKVGSLGDIGCFSFYPTKNLGGCGDGGMAITNDKKIYERLLMLRDYGRTSRYEHNAVGYNSRLDTIQAAILRIKLRYLDKWNDLRRSKAKLYTVYLKDIEGITVPYEADYAYHVYHIYAIRVKDRNAVLRKLSDKEIGVLIHYPIPLHLQKVYKEFGYQKGDFPVAEKVAQEILSLPMHPFLKYSEIEYVTKQIPTMLK